MDQTIIEIISAFGIILLGGIVFIFIKRFLRWSNGLTLFFYRNAPSIFDSDYDENAIIRMVEKFNNSWHQKLMVWMFKFLGIVFIIMGILFLLSILLDNLLQVV